MCEKCETSDQHYVFIRVQFWRGGQVILNTELGRASIEVKENERADIDGVVCATGVCATRCKPWCKRMACTKVSLGSLNVSFTCEGAQLPHEVQSSTRWILRVHATAQKTLGGDKLR